MPLYEIKKAKTKKVTLILGFIALLIIGLLVSVVHTMNSNRRLPTLLSAKKELAVRGDILSNDNFKISTSKKIYKATIDTRCLDLDKKELFISVFSIYSSIPEKEIRKRLNKGLKKKKGTLVLSYSINARDAKNLKLLSYKLRRLNVFKPIIIHGSKIIIGLDVKESGEKRIFPYVDTLTPVVGYISKYEDKNSKTKVKGRKGLEKQYNKILNKTTNGILKGERDASSEIIFNKNSIITTRKDGATLKLNIPLKLQKNIEIILDHYKEKLGAKEIIVAVMESNTGKILSLATSNRFYPQKIKQSDVDNGYLTVNAIEYPFEPGSVIKPISISLVIDHGLIKKSEVFKAHNKGPINSKGQYRKGVYKIKRHKIHDDHQFKKKWLTLDDIVVYSSNIGTLMLAQRLTGKQFFEGYKKFGLSKKTGIDLPYERTGIIHPKWKYSYSDKTGEDNIYKATASYGQGITATFMQILKAYSVFNNNGKIVVPQIVSKVIINNKEYKFKEKESLQVVQPSTANEMKRLLIKTVNKGTGTKTKINNLEIGGKTGTANIPKKGKYTRNYNSSFFGFVNGKKNKYTIGVTVREPISRGKYWYYYYASNSAVPVFKEIINTLLKLDYLELKD